MKITRDAGMCKWGTSEDVEVTIQASLSHTGKTRKAVKPIDKCIAPIIRALENAGIHMTASCCGHGKNEGRIDLADGRILTIK